MFDITKTVLQERRRSKDEEVERRINVYLDNLTESEVDRACCIDGTLEGIKEGLALFGGIIYVGTIAKLIIALAKKA